MYKIDNVVSYLFGDTPTYRIVATKKEPYTRQNGETIEVTDGNDYMIVKTPLANGEFGAFLHVPQAHLELISQN